MRQITLKLKVLSYWNLNEKFKKLTREQRNLKVLSYWNLNMIVDAITPHIMRLKVLSYWNLNKELQEKMLKGNGNLKYYHIGI